MDIQTRIARDRRADRIRRLIARIDLRILNLRFAESMAYAGAHAAICANDKKVARSAHALAARAIRAVETLQHRAVRLARAEINLLTEAHHA